MSGLVVKAAVLIVWTRLLGAIGRRVGPGRVGLLLGLPSTSAAALVACGREYGSGAAVVMADAGLLGLAAAVALPAAYARAAGRGHRTARSLFAGLACYVATAAGLATLPEVGPLGRVAIAAAVIAFADRRAIVRVRVEDAPRGRPRSRRASLTGALAPAGCLMLVAVLRGSVGAGWAGLLVPFPAATTALLVATHAEAGPAAAGRVAAAVPRGSLGTLAFLAVFRSLAATLGTGWAAAWGIAASAVALAIVAAVTRGPSASRGSRPAVRGRGISRIAAVAAGRTMPASPYLACVGPWSRPRPASFQRRVVRRPTRSPPSSPSLSPKGRGTGHDRGRSTPRRGPPREMDSPGGVHGPSKRTSLTVSGD